MHSFLFVQQSFEYGTSCVQTGECTEVHLNEEYIMFHLNDEYTEFYLAVV